MRAALEEMRHDLFDVGADPVRPGRSGRRHASAHPPRGHRTLGDALGRAPRTARHAAVVRPPGGPIAVLTPFTLTARDDAGRSRGTSAPGGDPGRVEDIDAITGCFPVTSTPEYARNLTVGPQPNRQVSIVEGRVHARSAHRRLGPRRKGIGSWLTPPQSDGHGPEHVHEGDVPRVLPWLGKKHRNRPRWPTRGRTTPLAETSLPALILAGAGSWWPTALLLTAVLRLWARCCRR